VLSGQLLQVSLVSAPSLAVLLLPALSLDLWSSCPAGFLLLLQLWWPQVNFSECRIKQGSAVLLPKDGGVQDGWQDVLHGQLTLTSGQICSGCKEHVQGQMGSWAL